jgi:hypothetical protein
MSFTSSLKVETGKRKETLNRIWKGSVVVAFQRAITGTPVDTGAARGSWLIGDVADTRVRNSLTPINVTPAQIPEVGQGVSLYSNLPYMQRLEDGWSQQAPSGWVHAIERDWRNIVRGQERVNA